jgi:endo-1,3(4)-beta-glucanase
MRWRPCPIFPTLMALANVRDFVESANMRGAIIAAMPCRSFVTSILACSSSVCILFFNLPSVAAKMSRLVLIADELGEHDLASSLRAQLRLRLGEWLSANNSDTLLYDSSWGGVITSHGFRDRFAEFGHAWYNDHHFHFGYFVYALACTLRPRDDAALGFLSTYREAILALVRDYANPSTSDSFFIPMRHQDAWDGHSWASGLFEFGDGRNQESSSESVNAYYAVTLLGEAMHDDKVRALGRAMLASETVRTRSGVAEWSGVEWSGVE